MFEYCPQGKQPKRSHCFQPMNREHRKIIHDLAEVYGVESVSYDSEPKRNVVITAHKYPTRALSALSPFIKVWPWLLGMVVCHSFISQGEVDLPEINSDVSDWARNVCKSSGSHRSYQTAQQQVCLLLWILN